MNYKIKFYELDNEFVTIAPCEADNSLHVKIKSNNIEQIKTSIALFLKAQQGLNDCENILNEVKQSETIDVLDMSIDALGLSVRVYNCLINAGIMTLGELINTNPETQEIINRVLAKMRIHAEHYEADELAFDDLMLFIESLLDRLEKLEQKK